MSADPGGTSRVVVDLAALGANYRYLKYRSRKRCAGVVKANAYGLGFEPVVSTLAAEGCEDIFVATLPEALQVRAHFPDLRILALSGVVDAASAGRAAEANIEPVINSAEQAHFWLPYASQPLTLHVDTGMQRLGLPLAELSVVDWSVFNVAMVMTHLACADQPDHPLNQRQLERFEKVCQSFPGTPTSIANSAGCLLPEAWHGDLTRPGIGLYGGHPQNRIPDNPLQAVVHLQGKVVARRSIEPGTEVGYGATFVASRSTQLAVVGLGYADGLPRSLSSTGEVSFASVRAPIIGRVSMDLTHVDVTDLGPSMSDAPQLGDWVEFLGSDIGVDEVAQWANTIGLEILCGLGRRPYWEYRR